MPPGAARALQKPRLLLAVPEQLVEAALALAARDEGDVLVGDELLEIGLHVPEREARGALDLVTVDEEPLVGAFLAALQEVAARSAGLGGLRRGGRLALAGDEVRDGAQERARRGRELVEVAGEDDGAQLAGQDDIGFGRFDVRDAPPVDEDRLPRPLVLVEERDRLDERRGTSSARASG